MSGRDEDEMELLRCLKGHVIKTYKNSKFTDVTIKSKDGLEIKAHKLVLYAQNAWFASKLGTDADSKEIVLDDFSGDVVKVVVDSIYYRRMSPSLLTVENVMDFLKAGDQFCIDSIRDEAAVFMIKNLNERYALDMLVHPIFAGAMTDTVLKFIAENFQQFLLSDTLKEKLLKELTVPNMVDILSHKGLMLWDESGRYLLAVERETQLFFFVLQYIKQDKDARLEELRLLMRSLKLALLVPNNILTIQVIAEKLEVQPDLVSEKISDIVEPFKNLKSSENLASLTHKDRKDKSKASSDTKSIAESCRMRFGSIPHISTCSDLVLKLEPWSQISQTKFQFAPSQTTNKMAVCKKNMKSITVFIKKMDKQTKKDTETVDTDKNQDKKDEKEENKDADKSEKPVEEEKKKDEKVNGEAENCEKKKDEKGNGEKKKDEKGNGEKKKDGKGNGEKEKEDVTNKTKDSDEFRVCGVSVSDDDGSYEIGVVEGEGVRSREYILEAGEYIIEIAALYSQEKVSGLEKHGKGKEKVAQEMFSATTVEDYCFATNKPRTLGPVLEGSTQPVPGFLFRLPKQILRLEKGSPGKYFWLKGFGLETVELKDSSEKSRLYPIWGFHSAYKYYPFDHQGFEFLPGIKKQFQFSLEGINETLSLDSIQDLDTLERTPVHEVVDLDDSEEGEEGGSEEEINRPTNDGENEDSVMIVDSGSDGEDEEEEDERGEEEEEDEDDDDQDPDPYLRDISRNGGFAGFGHGRGGGVTGRGGEAEPIEIPSSSEEEEEAETDEAGDKPSKRTASTEPGSTKRTKYQE